MNKNITFPRRNKRSILRISLISIILIIVVIAMFVGPMPDKVRKYDTYRIDDISLEFFRIFKIH